MKVCFIINPASGQDEAVLSIINRTLKDTEIDWDVKVTRKGGDARQFAREAAQSGLDVVAIYGGDGSVMEAASGLMGTQTPLLILPGGTANVMSNELNIPQTLAEALKLLNEDAHRLQPIDLGICNDAHIFSLRVAMGWEADMVEAADRELKDRLGVLAYLFSAVTKLAQAAPSKYHLTIDGKQIEDEGFSIAIANSANFGLPGRTLVQGCNVTDGLLDVIVFRRKDLGGLVGSAATVFLNSENQDLIAHYQGRDIHVQADPPQTMQVDGELIEGSSAQVKILPSAVTVIVPIAAAQQAPAPQSETGVEEKPAPNAAAAAAATVLGAAAQASTPPTEDKQSPK